jgi:ribose transport system permease protein
MNARLAQLLKGKSSRQGLWILPLLLALAVSLVLAILTKDFAGVENLSNLVAQAMPLIITAIGQMFVIVIGGLDLSVGSVVSFTTAILALDAPAYFTVPAVFVLAALIGLTYIVLGVTRILRPVSGGTVPDIVTQLVKGSVLGISMPMIWGVFVVLIAWKLLHASRFGLHLFAIGGGIASGTEDAARNFGVPVRRNIIFAYVACSCFAALAGVFLAGRIVSGDPNVGLLFELDAITAVAIGGTQLSGGIGSLHGTVIGALVLALLSNGMNLANVSPFIQNAIKGTILMLVVAFQSRKKIGL